MEEQLMEAFAIGFVKWLKSMEAERITVNYYANLDYSVEYYTFMMKEYRKKLKEANNDQR